MPKTTPKKRNLLFVIADGEHARFVRSAEGHTLCSDATLDPVCADRSAADLDPAHPPVLTVTGVSCHTGSAAHHALASRHDLLALEKARFGRAIATRLNAAAAANSFDELVIVAPPHTLLAVRQRLSAATNARLVGTLAKDLAKAPDGELWPHLQWWIRPVRRATS